MTGGDYTMTEAWNLQLQADNARLRKTLQTARDQVVAAMLREWGPDTAVAAVAYIDAALEQKDPS